MGYRFWRLELSILLSSMLRLNNGDRALLSRTCTLGWRQQMSRIVSFLLAGIIFLPIIAKAQDPGTAPAPDSFQQLRRDYQVLARDYQSVGADILTKQADFGLLNIKILTDLVHDFVG